MLATLPSLIGAVLPRSNPIPPILTTPRLARGTEDGLGSLSDRAYELLKRRIITLRYAPGTYINEAQLCADLGLGRTPVHQAVNRLALEGMVQTMPRKGNIVAPISLNDALTVFEVRLIIEPAAARLAAERATDADHTAMRALLERSQALLQSVDIEALMEIDRDFHILLARATRNPLLEQTLVRLHERALRFWFVSLSSQQNVPGVADEHQEVVARIVARDADGAEHAMQRHIVSSRDRIRNSV